MGQVSATGPKNKNGVQFGGAGQALLNGSVGTFQNITEVFLWGFLAQDMIAMWLPRVWTSLQEGRKPYEPAKDPEMKDKPFSEQLKAWVTGNAQGLNWVNFYEGTKREIATGPGLLAVPALAFMINRAVLSPGIELSYGSLKGMGEGLKAHIGALGKPDSHYSGEKGQKYFLKDVKDYLKQGFVDINQVAEGKTGASSGAVKQAEDLQKLIGEWVDAEVQESVEHARLKPHERWWENARQVFGKGPMTDWVNGQEKPKAQQLSEKRKQVEEGLWQFNRDHRVNEYGELKGLIKDTTPLNNTGKTWHTYDTNKFDEAVQKAVKSNKQVFTEEELAKLRTQKGFGEIKNDMTRVGGFVNQIWENHTKDARKGMGEVVEHTMKQMIGRKWAFGMGITALTAAYLVKLAFWAQNSNTYQATRLLNADAAKSKGNTAQGGSAEGSRTGQSSNSAQPQQVQAGLPFGSQPAFSHLQTTFPVRPQLSLSQNGFIQSPVNPFTPAYFRGRSIAEGGQA